MMMYCNVIVTRPFDHAFTYRIKNNQKVKIGSIVSVPFGKKKDQLGMVYELINQPDKCETFTIKEIGYIFDEIVLNTLFEPVILHGRPGPIMCADRIHCLQTWNPCPSQV